MTHLRLKLLCAAAVMIGGYVLLFPSGSDDPIASTKSGVAERHTVASSRSTSGEAATPGRHHAVFEFGNRVASDAAAAALFAAHSWYVAPPAPPPPPPPVAVAPPAPTAPPLPFNYMGSYRPDGAQPVFFLTQGDRVYEVKIGDVLDNLYSVDAVNGSNLMLTYKPLNIQQALPVEGKH
jgi:hypothetical protein